MSNSRQTPSRVRSYAVTHPPGRVALPTRPGWDSLVFARAGAFTVTTNERAWIVPARRAVCVPDGNHVRVDTARRCPIRCLYVDARLDAVGDDLRVISLAPLTRELVTHAVAIAPLTLEDKADRALLTLLTERLAAEPDTPLHLPLPSDAAAADVATAIMAEPAWPLDRCLSAAGASRRTVERRFKSETLMSLGQWRRRARVLEAVAMLAQGESVTSTANAVGYASPSSFVFAFRAELGSSPRTFMDSSGSVSGPARRESR